MAAMRAGSSAALGQLYDRYCSRAYRVALAVCADPRSAEDSVQNAFVSIWTGRAGYNPQRGSVATWLLAIVRHRAIDTARASSGRARRLAAADRLQACPGADDPPRQVERHDDARRIREMLALLSEPQREVIVLSYYGGLSHREIALHLGIPPGTVKGRMRLGLDKLKDALELAGAAHSS